MRIVGGLDNRVSELMDYADRIHEGLETFNLNGLNEAERLVKKVLENHGDIRVQQIYNYLLGKIYEYQESKKSETNG